MKLLNTLESQYCLTSQIALTVSLHVMIYIYCAIHNHAHAVQIGHIDMTHV